MPASERVEILIAGPFDDPEEGFGLQQALLEEVAAQERGPTALMWTSSRYVGATRQETRLPGFAAVTEAASGLGFPVLVRNSGGGAVAANRGSLSFSLTFPVEDLRHGLYERYSEGLDLIASALRRIGSKRRAVRSRASSVLGLTPCDPAARGASSTPGWHKGSPAGPPAWKPSFWSLRRLRSGPYSSASMVFGTTVQAREHRGPAGRCIAGDKGALRGPAGTLPDEERPDREEDHGPGVVVAGRVACHPRHRFSL